MQQVSPMPAERQRFAFIAAPEFKKRPAPKYLVENILVEKTMSCLLGPPATYKSFLAVSLAAAVSTGTSWYGNKTLQKPVIYISGEGAAGLGQRQKAWELHSKTELPDSCYFLPEAVQIHAEKELEELISAIRKLPHKPGLIIIDTLARCLVGGDENSAKDMGMFIAGADRLRTETGAHILIVHHFNKDGKARGSSALPGALDTQIEVKRYKDKLKVTCVKQKDANEFQEINLRRHIIPVDEKHNSLVFTLDEETTPEETEPKENATLQALIDAQTPLKASQWQIIAEEKYGVKRRTFYNHRDELITTKKVAKKGSLYTPTDLVQKLVQVAPTTNSKF